MKKIEKGQIRKSTQFRSVQVMSGFTDPIRQSPAPNEQPGEQPAHLRMWVSQPESELQDLLARIAAQGGEHHESGSTQSGSKDSRANGEDQTTDAEAALSKLYDLTSSLVFGIALRFVRDEQVAEEVTMDVFTQVWAKASHYAPRLGRPRTWLSVLARSRSIDRLRQDRPQKTHEKSYEQELENSKLETAVTYTDSSEVAYRSELGEVLRRALQSLPGAQRQPVLLAYASGWAHTRIATSLGLPLGTVKTRIRLGLGKLRSALSSLEGEDL